MSIEENAWKLDAQGYYIEMEVGERKDYSIDWEDFLESLAITASAFTLGAGLTKVSEEISGDLTKVTINADTAGTHSCSHLLTFGAAGFKEVTLFRVRVT